VSSTFGLGNLGWASAAGPAATVQAGLAAALAGGDPVHSLFATDLQALGAVREAAAGGATTWLAGTDTETGQPTRYVAVGDTFLSVGIVPSGTAAQTLEAGSDEPATIGFLYLTLLTGAGGDSPVVTQLLSGTATYSGDPLPAFAAGDGLKDLIGTLVDKGTDFVGSLVELAWEKEAGDIAGAGQATADAADAAAENVSGPTVITGPGGVQVQTDVEMTVGESVSLGLGIVAVLAALVLDVLAKQLTGYVRVYNTTTEELDVSLAWVHTGVGYAGPRATEAVTLPPVGPVWTPPWVIGERAVSYAGWVLGNTDSLSPVGYVIRIAATEDFAGADVMVDIPITGANSLAVQVGAGTDFGAFYAANAGQNTALAASASGTGSPYQVTIATNQNSGRSASPTDGALGYDYEHLIVIAPAG
jgi:hypothetical protein